MPKRFNRRRPATRRVQAEWSDTFAKLFDALAPEGWTPPAIVEGRFGRKAGTWKASYTAPDGARAIVFARLAGLDKPGQAHLVERGLSIHLRTRRPG